MYDKNFIMLLSSAHTDSEYIKQALEHDDCYKVLKNDMKDIDFSTYFRIADKYKASEVVLLDKELDGSGTIEYAKEQIEWLRERNLLGEYVLQVVCYAESLEEFKTNLMQIAALPEVKVVGLPKTLSTWCPNANRKDLIALVREAGKQVHLLGFWYSMQELLDMPYSSLRLIRSADTTLYALSALEGSSVFKDRRGTTLDTSHCYVGLFREAYDNVMTDYFQHIYDKAAAEGALGS